MLHIKLLKSILKKNVSLIPPLTLSFNFFFLNVADTFYYSTIPYIGVPFDIQIVEVVGVFQLACLWTLEPLNDLCFHFHGNVSRQ